MVEIPHDPLSRWQIPSVVSRERFWRGEVRVLSIGMLLLGVMRLVEDQDANPFNRDERMQQALMEDIGRADDDHVVMEVSIPGLLGP